MTIGTVCFRISKRIAMIELEIDKQPLVEWRPTTYMPFIPWINWLRIKWFEFRSMWTRFAFTFKIKRTHSFQINVAQISWNTFQKLFIYSSNRLDLRWSWVNWNKNTGIICSLMNIYFWIFLKEIWIIKQKTCQTTCNKIPKKWF